MVSERRGFGFLDIVVNNAGCMLHSRRWLSLGSMEFDFGYEFARKCFFVAPAVARRLISARLRTHH